MGEAVITYSLRIWRELEICVYMKWIYTCHMRWTSWKVNRFMCRCPTHTVSWFLPESWFYGNLYTYGFKECLWCTFFISAICFEFFMQRVVFIWGWTQYPAVWDHRLQTLSSQTTEEAQWRLFRLQRYYEWNSPLFSMVIHLETFLLKYRRWCESLAGVAQRLQLSLQ